MSKQLTKQDIEDRINDCRSFTELTILLGRKPIGGNIVQMRVRCRKFGIDTSHFTGKGHSKGKVARNKLTPSEIFGVGLPTDRRKEAHQLRRALLESGVAYKCETCGISEWMEQPLVLDVDHRDGQYWNNTKKNLRFLCPNCHRQTATHGAKNIRPS